LEESFPNSLGHATAMNGKENVEGNIDFAKDLQDTLIAKNDLSIPILLHCEAVTGANIAEGTIFPSAIGLGAT
jgi:beta-glucosidase